VPRGREGLLERRRELIHREHTVRARYGEVVSIPVTDERAHAENIEYPLAEHFLDALITTQNALDALEHGLEATSRRELGRWVGRYQHAMTRLERARDGIAHGGPTASG
jgi:hypothetical protein